MAALARKLSGGLGWGKADVPSRDEEVVHGTSTRDDYNMYTAMRAQAHEALRQGQYKLATDLFQGCVTFYEGLGLHWLCTPRKWVLSAAIAMCLLHLEGTEAAEAAISQVRRKAQRELGPSHKVTVDAIWHHAGLLLDLKRTEQAMSFYFKATRLCTERLGANHAQVFSYQVRQARTRGTINLGSHVHFGRAAIRAAI